MCTDRPLVGLPDDFYSKAYARSQATEFPASVVKFLPQPLLDLVPQKMPVMNALPADDQRKGHTGTPEMNLRFEIILDPVLATF